MCPAESQKFLAPRFPRHLAAGERLEMWVMLRYLIGSLGEREGSTANIAVRRFIAIADDQDLWRPRQALEYSKISPAVELKGQQATCAVKSK